MPNTIAPLSHTLLAQQAMPTILERRRRSEEEAIGQHLRNLQALNSALAERNLKREAELRQEAQAKRSVSLAPSMPSLTLPTPPPDVRRTSDTAVVRSGSTSPMPTRFSEPAIEWHNSWSGAQSPRPSRPPMLSRGSSGQRRALRHYFDLSPGSRPDGSPRSGFFTPLPADERVDTVAPEPITIRDRLALGSMALGMVALAAPVLMLIGRAIKRGIDAVTQKIGS